MLTLRNRIVRWEIQQNNYTVQVLNQGIQEGVIDLQVHLISIAQKVTEFQVYQKQVTSLQVLVERVDRRKPTLWQNNR